ncbi:800_t:CDS:2 [Cetraspora pellucida]|uniref:800_t:CDS:1 n=1 Tax=Cetraspora pellucida TaxID=1433469 RepID=A0A9N9J142_9GLOM|nr:800_t:CDS:2 [Cetraspora pellucida]
MSEIRYDIAWAVFHRICVLTDINEFEADMKTVECAINKYKFLTQSEKDYIIFQFSILVDKVNISNKKTEQRECEICQNWTYAQQYCDYCIRNYLTDHFNNWSSGNIEIDELIRECQLNTQRPDYVVEWIPYKNFSDIKYKTKGGCSSIYNAIWKDGRYDTWDKQNRRLKRAGTEHVILKRLDHSNGLNKKWIIEIKSHLNFMNKISCVVRCHGITFDPNTQDFMLVLNLMEYSLREYLLQNHKYILWEQKIRIIYDIAYAINMIHRLDTIHRDLHSGNVLQTRFSKWWYISDFGLYGSVTQEQGDIYGNLPYIAPEIINGKPATKESDIYSFAMLMWEILSGIPPFQGRDHGSSLAYDILEGIRPPIDKYTPYWYTKLMKQCWDANPKNRPKSSTILNEIRKQLRIIYQNELENSKPIQIAINNNGNTENQTYSPSTTLSKIYKFKDLPEPQNRIQDYDFNDDDFMRINEILKLDSTDDDEFFDLFGE